MARGQRVTTAPNPSAKHPNLRKKQGDGVPGVDYSGVHPETGKYTVVRGNYKGVKGRQQAKNLKKADNYKSHKPGEIDPKAPITPKDRSRKDMKICGANRTGRSTSGPGICCNPAGWGTEHLGYGHCRHHGGLLETHEKAAQIQKATDLMEMYGLPIETDPHVAIMQEVSRCAGHVKWLQTLISGFEDKKQLTQWSEATGVTPSVWIELYHKERDRLVAASKAALAAGVAERQVRIAEEQGRLFAMVIQRIFTDPRLEITNVQKAIMPVVVREHMMALDTDADIEEAELVE